MSGWNKAHPIVIFLYYMGLCMFSMLLLHPLYLFTALCWTFILWFMSDKGGYRWRMFFLYLLMGLVISLGNPLFSHRGATILFYMFDQPITLESFLYGLFMMKSLLAIMFAFQSYRVVMTGDKTMALFASFLPRTALALRIAVRFVPLLIRRWKQVAEVQRTQGLLFGQGSWKRKASDGMNLVSILLAWSLEAAIVSAMSMRSRGYGTVKRSQYSVFAIKKEDVIALVWMIVAASVLIAGKYMGYAVLQVYPRIRSVEWDGMQSVIYAIFCIYLLVPLYFQGREWLSWLCWKYRTSRLLTLKQSGKL